jgi:hypothetical protein
LKLYKDKETKIVESKLKKIECDNCHKFIQNEEFYYSVLTFHMLWGNDSAESSEYLDFCCDKCLIENLSNYLNNAGKTYNYQIEKCFYIENKELGDKF